MIVANIRKKRPPFDSRFMLSNQLLLYKDIHQAFEESVDDYLDFCAQRGESPEKPFSGKFQVRLPAELHQQAYASARAAHISLNEFVKRAVQRQLD
jgi:predicted HicB family RNase H-like nuclease